MLIPHTQSLGIAQMFPVLSVKTPQESVPTTSISFSLLHRLLDKLTMSAPRVAHPFTLHAYQDYQTDQATEKDVLYGKLPSFIGHGLASLGVVMGIGLIFGYVKPLGLAAVINGAIAVAIGGAIALKNHPFSEEKHRISVVRGKVAFKITLRKLADKKEKLDDLLRRPTLTTGEIDYFCALAQDFSELTTTLKAQIKKGELSHGFLEHAAEVKRKKSTPEGVLRACEDYHAALPTREEWIRRQSESYRGESTHMRFAVASTVVVEEVPEDVILSEERKKTK